MERRRHCRCRGGELRRTLALLRRARLRNREQWRDPCGALGTLAFGVGPVGRRVRISFAPAASLSQQWTAGLYPKNPAVSRRSARARGR